MWIDVKTLSNAIGKSPRTVQKRVKEDTSIITKAINKKSYAILVSSLPEEWQATLVKKDVLNTEIDSNDILNQLAQPAGVVAINKTSIKKSLGSKLSENQRVKILIALRLKNKPHTISKNQWEETIAMYFDKSVSTIRRIGKEVNEFGVLGKPRQTTKNNNWDDEAIKFLQGYYLAALKQHGACNKKTAWEALVNKANLENWEYGCKSSAYKILGEINPLLTSFATGGNRALDNYFWIARNCDALNPFQVVIGDQHIFDYWIADYETGLIRRPECYLWIDMCTKLIYGIAFDKHYSSDTVRESLRLGLHRFGAFDCTYNDNGTSECSKAINLIIDDLLKLGMRNSDISELYKTSNGDYVIEDDNSMVIDVANTEKEWKRKHRRIFAGVKNAKAKDIERFFRNFESRLDAKMIPGRCATPGANAAIDEVERKRLERQKDNHELLTEQQFISVCLEVLQEYEHERHSTLKMSPWQKLQEKQSKGWKAKFYDKFDIDFALAERKLCTVTRGRIVIDNIWYIGKSLEAENGQIKDEGIYKFDGSKLEIRYNRHFREKAYAVTPEGEIRILKPVNASAVTMLDDQAMIDAIANKRHQIKAVKEAFNNLVKPIGDVTYKPQIEEIIKPVEKEEEEEIKPKLIIPDKVTKTVIRPLRPLLPTESQRYQWCLEMLIQGAPLPIDDELFMKEYKETQEYEEYQEYWESLEERIGG